MAQLFFSLYVSIDKCTELETKLKSVRLGKIVKRRRSEYIPINSVKKRQRLYSESQVQEEYRAGLSHFDADDEPNLLFDEESEASTHKSPICLNQFTHSLKKYHQI